MVLFDNMQRKISARWGQHDVHMANPVLEFEGPAADTVSMDITYDSLNGTLPIIELGILNMLIENGVVVPLLIGPVFLGMFAIQSSTEKWRRFGRYGIVQRIEVSVDLKRDNFSIMSKLAAGF